MRTAIIMLLLLFAVLPPCAYADAFYQVLQYTCDTKGNYVQVQLLGAYNEEGKALADKKDENAWNPWQFVGDGGTGRYIKETRTIQKSCVLSDGTYIVEIGPKPCNFDTLGESGAMMMAWAKITKDGKQLAHTDFGACSIGDAKLTTRLQIWPGQEPIIEQKSGWDYFK